MPAQGCTHCLGEAACAPCIHVRHVQLGWGLAPDLIGSRLVHRVLSLGAVPAGHHNVSHHTCVISLGQITQTGMSFVLPVYDQSSCLQDSITSVTGGNRCSTHSHRATPRAADILSISRQVGYSSQLVHRPARGYILEPCGERVPHAKLDLWHTSTVIEPHDTQLACHIKGRPSPGGGTPYNESCMAYYLYHGWCIPLSCLLLFGGGSRLHKAILQPDFSTYKGHNLGPC
jgi:hypothetical protein